MSFASPTNYPLINNPWEIAQPFNIDQYGEIAYTDSPNEAVEARILACLLTNPGERVMRPSYGIGMVALVFANEDPLTLAQYQGEIQQQLAIYEPGIQVQSVSLVPDPLTQGQVNVTLVYTIAATGQTYTSVISANQQVVETRV